MLILTGPICQVGAYAGLCLISLVTRRLEAAISSRGRWKSVNWRAPRWFPSHFLRVPLVLPGMFGIEVEVGGAPACWLLNFVLLHPDHCAGHGRTTWCGLARKVFELSKPCLSRIPKVDAIPTVAYQGSAKRPGNSVLNCRHLARIFGIQLRSWDEALPEMLNETLNLNK